jgi:glucokinase
MRAFRNQGKMSSYVETIPVRVVTRAEAGLVGAVLAATRLK